VLQNGRRRLADGGRRLRKFGQFAAGGDELRFEVVSRFLGFAELIAMLGEALFGDRDQELDAIALRAAILIFELLSFNALFELERALASAAAASVVAGAAAVAKACCLADSFWITV
jgi:hypothetical protein